jgi:glyoxylate reductase
LKPKVLVSTGKLNFPEDLAESLRPLADVAYVQGGYAEQLREATAVVVSMEAVNDAYLAKAPKLKVVARFGVGYDTVDVETCTRRKVYVTHTPDVLSAAVADITWALILGFMRRIPEADRFTREEWGKRARGFPFGWDISGKTLGFLGLGRIGAEAAKRAQGFDVKVIYRDIVPKPELERLYGVKPVGFEELLRTSDILSIHVPLLPSTRHIIGRKELAMMKTTAIIINTSRGPVIDQDALTEALKTRRIAGAALDVFEEEPIPLTHPLLKLDNLVVTPHIASATRETRRRMAERCAESVRALLEGRRPPFTVPEQGNVSF